MEFNNYIQKHMRNGTITAFIIVTLCFPINAEKINLFGANGHFSLISSTYYFNDTDSIASEDRTALSRGFGVGVFYDSRFAVYSGFRINITIFPAWETKDNIINRTLNETMIQGEIFSKIYFRHEKMNKYSFWFGYGPAMQYILSEKFNNSILNLNLGFGMNYRKNRKIYMIPEILLGTNLFLKNRKFNDVVQNATQTTNFLRNGFTLSLRVGIGYNKIFIKRN
jgi:hypothetical protein